MGENDSKRAVETGSPFAVRDVLRDFDPDALLFRDPICVADEQTAAYYRDKTVLVTGGGGSIGSELCRRVSEMNPRRIVIVDICENGAYGVWRELSDIFGANLDVEVEILSICNRPALERIFDRYRPQIVLHAAAHKHVPLMERNVCEAIGNNVFGTLNCVECAETYRAERFMMLSTDKAVNPTGVMGATKRVCERIVQGRGSDRSTVFSATRFGNVLNSAGSVIPLFLRQIRDGKPITLTDRRIVRYFMSLSEAAGLVLQAGAMAKNGELFVLDMGNPIRISDLAERLIRLCGYEPYRDVDIVEIGLRPGEKLYEELLVRTEDVTRTANRKIFIERDRSEDPEHLREMLALLRAAADSGDENAAREALRRCVPTYRSPEEVNGNAEDSAEMRSAER